MTPIRRTRSVVRENGGRPDDRRFTYETEEFPSPHGPPLSLESYGLPHRRNWEAVLCGTGNLIRSISGLAPRRRQAAFAPASR
jgi:hypothetical protein